MISWLNRDKAVSKREAIDLIASQLIFVSIHKSNNDSLYKEIEEFAIKHQIPFSIEMQKELFSKIEEINPNWSKPILKI